MTKTVFCANCQTETDHDATIADNGDLILTCNCGRALKFPASFDADQLTEALQAHKDANEGQVTIEGQLAKFGLADASAAPQNAEGPAVAPDQSGSSSAPIDFNQPVDISQSVDVAPPVEEVA